MREDLPAIAFAAQAGVMLGAVALSGWIARRPAWAWRGVCVAALLLMAAWPMMRVRPTLFIDTLGAPAAACLELTGIALPAALLLAVAARHLPRAGDRRALWLLLPVIAAYFLRVGWWMIVPPTLALGPPRVDPDGVVRQTTGSTCVAASLATMLNARGVSATEAQMARLAYVDAGGATDSRAVWALQRALRGTPLRVRYASTDLAGLIAAPKPCLVQIDWSYFISHMVPVMQASERGVIIGDPLTGRREMSTADFARLWKGQLITLEEGPAQATQDAKRPAGQRTRPSTGTIVSNAGGDPSRSAPTVNGGPGSEGP